MDLQISGNGVEFDRENTNDEVALDVRCGEVQEIIGRPPHWLVRWGVATFFGVVVMVLGSASIIEYPDSIVARLRVTAANPPQALQSRIDGRIARVLTENNRQVAQGDVLAWMESIAAPDQVLQLSTLVDSMHTWLLNEELSRIGNVDLSRFVSLGELQIAFQEFQVAWRQLVSILPGGFYQKEYELLRTEVEFSKELLEILRKERVVWEQNYRLAERDYQIHRRLAEKEYLAPIEYIRAEREVMSVQLPLMQTEAAIVSNQTLQVSREKELIRLERSMSDQAFAFMQAVNSMKTAVERWKAQYALVAPLAGRVVFAGVVHDNQLVIEGQEIFHIHPGSTETFGELALTQNSVGKIDVGQDVIVRFDAYPGHEFGSVEGRIEYISDIAIRDTLVFAKVRFPNGLETTYGYELSPRNGLMGTAEVITEDARLLERIYNKIAKGIVH